MVGDAYAFVKTQFPYVSRETYFKLDADCEYLPIPIYPHHLLSTR